MYDDFVQIIRYFEAIIRHSNLSAAFTKLYSPTSANNIILACVQYIFKHKIFPQHRPLSN